MKRISFNDGWECRPRVNPFAEMTQVPPPWQPVTLPHDATLHAHRLADADPGMEAGAQAFFPGGVFEYQKRFALPESSEDKRVMLELEGVYRDGMVYVNGEFAGHRPYGYSQLVIDADPFLRSGENVIRVDARSHRDSRWYTGTGIYRDTWLLVGELVRVAPYGIRVATPDIDTDLATVDVSTEIVNDSPQLHTVELTVEICDPSGAVVASDTSKVSVLPRDAITARSRVFVKEPQLWDLDTPSLYSAGVTVRTADGREDADEVAFGIRRVQVDPTRGLRINGKDVKLRGACIHHDNGPLGAATITRAEERRVQILAASGFNAIRMSHNPMSRAMLDACDREGVLVMDEAFDMWTSSKAPFDYSLAFPEWWERDIEAMIAKDYNHPSVIMYSIGNEIPETGTPTGARLGRLIAEKVRALDPTRLVTNGVNGMVSVMSDLMALRQAAADEAQSAAPADAVGVNTMMASLGELMNAISASDFVTERTSESFSYLDVAGMNYSESRYEPDGKAFPHRVIVGSETFPTHIDGNWRLVEENSHVIGDFTWAGWDYLGEAGIGRPRYVDPTGEAERQLAAPYPYLVAHTGDIDITGHRRPASYYREIVFGLRREPYIAVRRPELVGKQFAGSPWAWSDAVSSWSWAGQEGVAVEVEVYSDAAEVELFVNGNSLGTKLCGAEQRFRAVFETPYEPGEVRAVALRDGAPGNDFVLRSATQPVLLTAAADRPVVNADPSDLVFVSLALADEHGEVHVGADRPVTVEISGPGELAALGSSAPSTEESFSTATRFTHDGRALAIVRPTGVGPILLKASTPGCDTVEVEIVARRA